MMLCCALPVNTLRNFIQRAAVRGPNKDQINMEEAPREGRVWAEVGATWDMDNAIKFITVMSK